MTVGLVLNRTWYYVKYIDLISIPGESAYGAYDLYLVRTRGRQDVKIQRLTLTEAVRIGERYASHRADITTNSSDHCAR